MNKPITFVILLFSLLSAFAQNPKVFNIDATRTTSLHLSDIAEDVIPIPLSKDISFINGAFWTGEYLFISTLRDVWQYDASGKFLRTISCNGKSVSSVAGDLIKKEIYIPVSAAESEQSELLCYDYSAKLLKKIALKNPSVVSCLYHNDALWILSEKLVDGKVRGYYSYVNISTGKETFLLQAYERPSSEDSEKVGFVGTLAISNNCLYANWDNNVIWRIKNKKVEQAYKCEVVQEYQDQILCLKGIVGNYLFFNYCLNHGESNMYLRHLKTGAYYNVNYRGAYGNYTQGAVDDIYNSGYFAILREPLSQEGYFWFIKDMRGKSLGDVPVKGNQVVFIVKMKQ